MVLRHRLFWRKQIIWWSLLCLFLGCDTGQIANLGSISIKADLRLNYIQVLILLQDAAGNYLVWNQSILRPEGSVSVIPEEDFKTHVIVYSMKHGEKSQKVYDGRLRGLRWNRIIAETPRVLLGDIPVVLIQKDLDRDTNLGIIELTLTTPKQGDFLAELDNVQIYSY